MQTIKFLFFLFSVITLISCGKTKCDDEAPSTVASQTEINVLKDHLSSNGLTAVQHPNGFFYSITDQGSGTTPSLCASITIRYKGTLLNGSKFDESTSNVSFQLNQLIAGWKLGIPLIQKGGKIKLYIPPSLAYGSVSQSGIPANSSLIFDIDLIGVEN